MKRTFSFYVLIATMAGIATGTMGKASEDSTILRDAGVPLDSIRPLGLFDLQAGATWRSTQMKSTIPGDGWRVNRAGGISVRMQSSILWSVRARNKAFTWGDILGAELFAGTLSTHLPHESGNAWIAYQFDFGFGGRLRLGRNSEAGVNVLLLKFSRDNVTGNISGSGVTGRYRYKRLLAEAGLVARHERALGVLTDIRDKISVQQAWTLRYLFRSGRNLGVTAETLSGHYHQDEFLYSKIWSVKIFYGIYF
jgi:hypothetical protein